MSTEYTKTNWQDGDIITADKMNNIENGIKGIEEATTHVKDDFGDISETETHTETQDIKQTVTKTRNCYYWVGENQNTTYFYVHIENLQEGDIITAMIGTQAQPIRFADAYSDDDRVASASTSQESYDYTVPSGVDNLYVSCYMRFVDDIEFYVKRTVTTVITSPKGFNDLSERTALLESDVSEIVHETEVESKNYFDVTTITTGKFVANTGNLGTNSAYNASDYVSVETGKTYTYQTGSTTASSRTKRTINQIAGYDENKVFVPGSYQTYSSSYTVPEGVKYVRFSLDAVYVQASQYPAFVKGTEIIDYSEYAEDQTIRVINPDMLPKTIKNGAVYSFDINSNDFDNGVSFQHMCGYSIHFNAQIDTFNEIKIGKGYQAYLGATLGIDATNIYIYEGASATPSLTEPHNLTLKDYISVDIIVRYGNVAEINVRTNGGTYQKPYYSWDARKGTLFVKSVGTNVLNGCTLGYYCYALETPTYIYGDSFLTNAQGVTDRWTSYLIAQKCTKYLLNGYSGRGSAEAIKSVAIDLQYGIPKRIIWCLGMNDPDSSAINSNWKNGVDTLEQLCNVYGIELILATIPNANNVDNTYKNAYVKSSGHRYIDFASAVGAESSSTWYDGMVSSDGVHPTVKGALALYSQAVSDVPELMSFQYH